MPTESHVHSGERYSVWSIRNTVSSQLWSKVVFPCDRSERREMLSRLQWLQRCASPHPRPGTDYNSIW